MLKDPHQRNRDIGMGTRTRVFGGRRGAEDIPEQAHTSVIRALQYEPFSPRFPSSTMVTGSWDHSVKVWSMETGEYLYDLEHRSCGDDDDADDDGDEQDLHGLVNSGCISPEEEIKM